MRVVAYARYSSDHQRDASLDDQLRNCRNYAQRQGWPEPIAYTDAAISGARKDRPSYRKLLSDANERRFDILLVDDLSRLSRDSADSAKAVKRLTFAGIRLIGVSDGVDTARKSHKADVGLRGLMSELYLDDLADKTHRGLSGRALAGASAGGLPYGYRVTTIGQRAINDAQAVVVRRIYAEYLAGHSPREIATVLNREGIVPPRGHSWSQTAIRGDLKRSLGILVNPLYAGRQVWNRSKWVKHPDTGRRIRKERPRSEWITSEHPDLRIVDAELFDAVQQRLHARTQVRSGCRGHVHRYLLSGLLRCSECGGKMIVSDPYAYVCADHKDRGTCPSTLRVPRRGAEDAILTGIREQLLSEAAFKLFARAVRAELARVAPSPDGARRKLAEAERVRGNILAAIRAGIITPSVRAELEAAEDDVAAAQRELESIRTWAPESFLPRARDVWNKLVADLGDVAANEVSAREALRTLIGNNIPVRNDNGVLVAEITPLSQLAVVAGARFVPQQRPFCVVIPSRAA